MYVTEILSPDKKASKPRINGCETWAHAFRGLSGGSKTIKSVQSVITVILAIGRRGKGAVTSCG